MKQKDIALIIIVVFFSAVVSILVSKMVFTSDDQRSMTVEVVEPIDPTFQLPDENFFNEQAINPTQLIQIGDNENQQPF